MFCVGTTNTQVETWCLKHAVCAGLTTGKLLAVSKTSRCKMKQSGGRVCRSIANSCARSRLNTFSIVVIPTFHQLSSTGWGTGTHSTQRQNSACHLLNSSTRSASLAGADVDWFFASTGSFFKSKSCHGSSGLLLMIFQSPRRKAAYLRNSK